VCTGVLESQRFRHSCSARHNVTGRNNDKQTCLSKNGAIPDSLVIYFHKGGGFTSIGEWIRITLPLYRPDGSPWWYEHPRLGAAVDVVALNLHWGSDVTKIPYYLKSNLDRFNLIICPGETVSVIGFPFGLSSSLRFPIWATGFLAQELDLVTPDNPVFLIDCRTRQGQSGSPVIAHRANGYICIENEKIVAKLNVPPAWELLGLYTGRVNQDSDLGKVWHVSVLEELLTASTLDKPTSLPHKKNPRS